MFQKRFIIILILVILILAFVGFFVFRGINKTNTPNNNLGNDSVDLFPFGQPSEQNTESNTSPKTGFEQTSQQNHPSESISVVGGGENGAKHIFLLSQNPVSGSGWTDSKRLYFTERSTGHIYSFNPETTQTTRVSNTTIPRTQKSTIGSSGSVLLQYIDEDLDSTESVWGFIEDGKITQEFLPNNITDISISPTGNTFFYLIGRVADSAGVLFSTNTKRSTNIFQSPAKQWVTQWFSPNTIALTTKAASGSDGVLYYLSANTGNTERVLSEKGLTTLVSPNGSTVLYSKTPLFGDLSTHLFNKTNNSHTELPLTTLPEKCVWENSTILYCGVPQKLSDAVYPDVWYQGSLFFNDTLWRIDTKTMETTRLFKTEDTLNGAVDATHLQISDDGLYLFFINKRDLLLWGVEL